MNIGNTKQMQMKINLDELEDIKCKGCGEGEYLQLFRFKRLPALISPSGKDEFINMNIMVCKNCGLQMGQDSQPNPEPPPQTEKSSILLS